MRFVWLLTVIIVMVLIHDTALAASSKKKSGGSKKSSSPKSTSKASDGNKSSDKEVSRSKTPSKSSKSSKSSSSKSKSSSKSSTSKTPKKKAAASEDDDEDEDKKTLAKPKRSSSASPAVVDELKKEQMKQRASTDRKRMSSPPSDVQLKQLLASRHGSHGKPYNPVTDLLWRTGHDHGVPNTPSLYLQFFEMKYALPFVLSLNRHLWLDTSPLHMHSSASQNDGKVKSTTSQFVMAPAYSICDMLPSLDTKVSCVKSPHILPHCPAKNSFTSQVSLLRRKSAPNNASAVAALANNRSVGVCFHSPILTNRSQLARQRYELFRRPEVRLDFRPTHRTLYDRFVAAYNVAFPPTVRTDLSSSSANNGGASTAVSNEAAAVNASTTAALISPSMVQRMQRLSQALYSSDRPRDHRLVVVHWHCPPTAALDTNRPHRQLRDNDRDRDSGRGSDRGQGGGSGSGSGRGSDSGSGRKKKSKNGANGGTTKTEPQKKPASKPASGTAGSAHSFSYCGKEFDNMLKTIDRERRLWDRVVGTSGSGHPQTIFDVLVVVTPPHDESYLPLPLDPSSSAQKQERLTLNHNTFLQSPFFNMLRRRLNASSTSPSASSASSSLGSVRLARDVLVELWPKIAVATAAPVTTNSTASAAAVAVAARAAVLPKAAEIHALEAQLMVDARVFYGLGSGVSLVQDAVESERALRYTNHTGCLLAQNMVVDRSSWCFAASPRSMSRNLPLQLL